MGKAVTVIAAKTAAQTSSYDTSGIDKGCTVIFYASGLGAAEQIQIGIPGSAGVALLFQDGAQIVLSATNPIQQVSSGPNYVLIKPVTAAVCAVDVCPVGK